MGNSPSKAAMKGMESAEMKEMESFVEEMKSAVNERRWKDGQTLLRGRDYKRKDIDAFITSCETLNRLYVSDDIMAHCSSDQLNRLISAAAKKEEWETAGRLLKFCEDRDMHVWIIAEVHKNNPCFEEWETGSLLKFCEDRDKLIWLIGEVFKKSSQPVVVLENAILPFCGNDAQLTYFVTINKWHSAGRILKTGVSDTQRRWAVEEASKKVDNRCFELYILPHCSDDQLESVLKLLVTRCMWESVGKVLERGVSDTQRRWAVEEASKKVDDRCFELYILPLCSDDQLESVLKLLVTRCMWESVGKVLERGVSDTQRRWAVEEASKKAYDWNLIMPHCSDDQLETVLKRLVNRGIWESVGKVLERGVGDTQRRWAVEEASKKAHDRFFELYILPHCSNDQLVSVLKRMVKRCMWQSVGKVLDRGVSDKQRKWAVEVACEKVDFWYFEFYILPHCTDDQLESTLKHLVKRGMWVSVGKVLERGVNDPQRRLAVEVASKKADDLDFKFYILPHCSDDQLESTMKQLVTRGMWKSVGNVLERGVNNTQRRRAVEVASKKADDVDFELYILPHCSDKQLESTLKQLVTRGMWKSVRKVLERDVSDTQRRWAVEVAGKKSNVLYFEHYILPHCSDDQLESTLKHLVKRGMWESVGKVLERGVSDTQRRWAVEEASEKAYDWNLIMPHCSDDQLETVLKRLVNRGMWESVGKVLERGVSDTPSRWAVEEASMKADDFYFLKYILPHCNDDQLKCTIPHLVHRKLDCSLDKVVEIGETLHMVLAEMCRIMSYHSVLTRIEKLGQLSTQLFKRCLSSPHLTSEGKNLVLHLALHQNKWDVIRKVGLEHVWEQVRRELFRAAVEQRKWRLVKKWADHTVYDNQRWWAQEEAYKEKQWDVMLVLTDYGMTDIELMRVRYRLAKYADWDVVVQMIERGVDVTEVRELVESAMISRKTARDKAKRRAMEVRWWQLRELEDYYTVASSGRVRQWSLVLFYLHRYPRRLSLQRLLQRAIKYEAWRVVRHLLKLGLDKSQRDSLLTAMISRRQWGVCRVLLEQGVSVQSCVEALPLFMDNDQWTLVARVMEFNMDDKLRHRVMRRAFERREGSVVWRCISTMQDYRLSEEERVELFEKAMYGGVWEAVKPLVEKEDSTGLRHRDTALLEAIDHHLWDVVDYCQWHGADINMKDDQGQTPLNRDGREKDWKAVKKLVIRGGDPNVPDVGKCCILNIAIRFNQWELVRLIIEYHGHIHVKDFFESTPIQFLIDKRQGEIIHHTLMWCPDQSKVVNERGETTLHAVALDKKPELLYSQIVRGVNPLTQTICRQSVLLYAVNNPHCAQRMVAECIKLGLGTNQPQLSGHLTMEDLCTELFNYIVGWNSEQFITSVLLLAVLRGLPVVAHMLYESGSCSYKQLLNLYTQLHDIYDPLKDGGRLLLERISKLPPSCKTACRGEYDRAMNNVTTFLPYLREMATTPRSLVSTCRLVISHCLVVRGRRERDVQQLPLTDNMKNFVLFSDLADPDYAWYLYGSLPPLTSEK